MITRLEHLRGLLRQAQEELRNASLKNQAGDELLPEKHEYIESITQMIDSVQQEILLEKAKEEV